MDSLHFLESKLCYSYLVPFNDSEGQCITYKSKAHSIKHLGVSAYGIHFPETATLGDLVLSLFFSFFLSFVCV